MAAKTRASRAEALKYKIVIASIQNSLIKLFSKKCSGAEMKHDFKNKRNKELQSVRKKYFRKIGCI